MAAPPRVDRYRLFYETLRTGGISSADALLRSMMDTAIEVAQADRGFLFLSREGGPHCIVARRAGREDVASPDQETSRRILEEAARASHLVVKSPAASELPASAVHLGLKGYMAVPITAQGRIVGFGYLDRLRDLPEPFTPMQQAAVGEFFADMAELVAAAEAHRQTRTEADRLRATVEGSRLFPEIVGRDPRLLDLLRELEAAAGSDASVLILGETGTGKELVARAIQRTSPRNERAFLTFNCAAVARELADAELFGHVRGSFTGASADRKGLFEEADGGTIFLDEVGDMPLEVQAKMLRVLQNGEVRRIGESRARTVDVRVLAATSRDLGADVEAGRFRRDLLFRLGVVTLTLPPLRTRPLDVPILAHHFLEQLRRRHGKSIVGFRRGALDALAAHPWPGNIRELENAVERAVLFARGSHVEPDDLRLGQATPAEPAGPGPAAIALDDGSGTIALEEVERRYFRYVLERVGFNRSEVARISGLPRTTLLARLRKLGLRP